MLLSSQETRNTSKNLYPYKQEKFFRTDNVISEDKLLRKCYDSKRDKYFEDVIEYEQAVETISCGYGDFTSLRIQGIISMSNINHICLMPREFFLKNKDFLKRATVTILKTLTRKEYEGGKYISGISSEEFLRLFHHFTGYNFQDAGVGPFNTWINFNTELFDVTSEHKIKLAKKLLFLYEDLEDTKFGSTMVDDSYYVVANDKRFAGKDKEQVRLTNQMSMADIGSDSGKIVIDLTLD